MRTKISRTRMRYDKHIGTYYLDIILVKKNQKKKWEQLGTYVIALSNAWKAN